VNIRFLTFAQQEIDEAYLWFEERSAGKGLDFLDELDRAVRLCLPTLALLRKSNRASGDASSLVFPTHFSMVSMATWW
jgi:hypothetical protein